MANQPTYEELKQMVKGLEKEVTDYKKSESALRDKQMELSAILRYAPLIIMFVDQGRRVRKVSDALIQFAGRREEEMLGLCGGEALRCIHHLDDPKGCGYGPNCEACPVRLVVLDTFKTGKSYNKVEAELSFEDDEVEERALLVSTALLDTPEKMVLVSIEDITERKRASEGLQKSEEKYRHLVESTSDWVWACDVEGRQTFANEAAKKMLGYEINEIEGTLTESLIHPEDRERVRKWFKISVKEKKGWRSSVIRWQHKDGTVRFLESTAKPILDPDDNLVGFTGVDRDVTKRKQDEEELRLSEEKFSKAFHSGGMLMTISSIDNGRYTDVNERFVKTTGYSREEAIGNTSVGLGFVSVGDREQLKEELIRNGNVQNMELELITKNGDKLYCIYFGEVITVNGKQKLLSSAQDITERKRAEEERARFYNEIESLNIELEDKVKERTRALELAVQEAEEANRAKSNFLASMSHELRTPLNAIIGFSEILEDQTFGKLNAKQAIYIKNVLGSGRHLLKLINDILDLSKVEAGKIELERSRVDLKGLLENSMAMVKELSLQGGISHDLQVPDELEGFEFSGDERKLKQIIFNLLSNAIKFTPENGSIRLEANLISDFGFRISELEKEEKVISDQSTIDNRQSAIEISVADSGIGIKPEDQKRVFRTFEQINSSYSRKQEGTGLGLALTKRLVELHGGCIWVESGGIGKGSRFSFVMPIKPAS